MGGFGEAFRSGTPELPLSLCFQRAQNPFNELHKLTYIIFFHKGLDLYN